MSVSRKSYSDSLRDPRWQKKRLEVLNAAEWRCHECQDETHEMHVHHRYYVSGREPWDYPDFALVALCDDHHKATHLAQEGGGTLAWEKMVVGLLDGLRVPTGADILCEFCSQAVTDENMGGKSGRHRFICEKCATKAEEERAFPE